MLTVLTGRSRRLWPQVVREIGEAYGQRTGRLLLLVPGQYTLQAELELVDRLDLPGFFDLEVLSPSRLLTRVFDMAGSPQRVRIDGRGKAMMLADVLRTSQKSLIYYGSAVGRSGFADGLAAFIADFKRAGLHPADVAALAEATKGEGALCSKLTDVALLYERYEERLEGAFLDSEDAQEALLARLPDSGLLEGSHVWIYGFDLIPSQFLRQIAVMARGAKEVRLALTLEDVEARDGAAFAPARDTLARLGRHFDRERLLWSREHVKEPLDAAPAIGHLEKELFAVPARAFDGDDTPVTLWVAQNPYDEAMGVAVTMLAYARRGVPFEEMAVVVGDVEAYAGAVAMAFERSGIPYHLARKRPALSHPLLRAWIHALRCVTLGWRMEDALEWLKGGFCGLTRDEVERLENHALENGLRSAKWRRPIVDVELDALRVRFIEPLTMLQTRLREARDATGTLAAVYGLLEDVNAYATLENWQRDLSARGLNIEAADCGQAWRLALETLDQLHALLHGRRQAMASIAQVMEAGLHAAELGALPAKPGAVQVGQLGHVKLGGSCRLLFLMGMEDGVMRPAEGALLSDGEAGRVTEAVGPDASLGLTGDALAQLMQINLLDTLAAPSERLFISHALMGADGEAKRAAAVLKLVRRLFPQMKERGITTEASPLMGHAPGAALDSLGPAFRAALNQNALDDRTADTAAWLLEAPETRRCAERVLRRLQTPVVRPPLPRQTTAELYAHTRTSVSRLETFALCPYKHFVQYGLKPVPRKAFDIAANETGTFYHRAMEEYAKLAAAEPAWPDVARAQSDALMNSALAPLIAGWEETAMDDNAMHRAAGEAFCRIARRAAWNYAGQMRRGAFRTKVVEARFGPGEALPPIALETSDGRRVWVEGRVDRIDFFADAEETWLCVVDYKSGMKGLDPSWLYGGLQLQLMLYLSVALSAYPGVKAGGAFYSRFDDPLVEVDSRDVEEIERLIAKKLRLKGVMLSDVRVARALETDESLLTKAGTIAKAANAVAGEDLEAMMAHARRMAAGIARQAAEGEIAARPAQLEAWRACQWCDYQDICGFDPTVEGQDSRCLEKLSQEALLEKLREE